MARARIMGARYPWYLLADSREGQVKEGEVTRSVPADTPRRANAPRRNLRRPRIWHRRARRPDRRRARGDGGGFRPADRRVVQLRRACIGVRPHGGADRVAGRSEEHTSELQSLMRTSYAV